MAPDRRSQLARGLHALAAAAVARMEAFACRRPLWFAAVVVGLLFGLVVVGLSPAFQTNDDFQLAMIASGKGACLAPDEHLIFTNVLVGQVLKQLYRWAEWAPWYGVYLYLVHYVAQVALLSSALAGGYSRVRVGLYLLYFAVVEIYFLHHVQFTTTAAVAAQCGLVTLMASRASGQGDRMRGYFLLLAGVVLVVLASLVRLEACQLAALIALPALCVMGWSWERRQLIQAIAASGVCLGVIAALAWYDDAYYRRDPGWRDFFSYNEVRLKFNDYGWTDYAPDTAASFAEVEWSANDHAMIAHWFYDDPGLYSEGRMRRLLASQRWQARRLTRDYCYRAARDMLHDKALWPALLAAPFFAWSVGSRRRLAAVAASAAMAVALLAWLTTFNKAPPSRVFLPALTFPLPLALVLTPLEMQLPRRRWKGLALRVFLRPGCWRRAGARKLMRPVLVGAALIAALVAPCYNAGRQYRQSRKMTAARRQWHASFAQLQPRADQLYVFWAPGFPHDVVSPLDNLGWLRDVHLLFMSWPQGTPIHEAMKRKFGVTDVYRALYERSDVLLLGNPECHRWYRKFVEEHHGVEVRFVETYDGGHPWDVAGHFEPSGGGIARRPTPSTATK